MDEADFRLSLERSIVRHSEDCARRGIWTEAASLQASRDESVELLPQGRETPDMHFAHVVDEKANVRVGETWYLAKERGGKTQFYVAWLWIDPEHRRKGYASQLLQVLADEAVQSGADRMELAVVFDNPGAQALYAKMGFRTVSYRMMKPVERGG